MNKPAGIDRGKAPWYLQVAEWGCCLLICLGPVLASVLTAQDAPRAASLLLCLGVMLLGIAGLAVVVGYKYKPRL